MVGSFIYAPEVAVRIRTAKNSRGKGQVIDVTEDVVSGSLTRVLNAPSRTDLTLLNQGRKYDGMFSPMDSVVVYLRRVRQPVLKFSGYLDAVPLYQGLPGSISLSASCTLKRLQHFYWDPTSPAGTALLANQAADPNNSHMNDGGLLNRTVRVLNEVAGWPRGQIHIARIPAGWYDRVSKVADELIAEAEALQMANTMGLGGVIAGQNPANGAAEIIPGDGEGTGTMPATSGKCSYFSVEATGHMGLTGETTANPIDPWYCAMRWPYVRQDLSPAPGVDVGRAKAWWKNRHILVVNPRTHKAVVVRAADWGPNINTGRVIDLSPRAFQSIGARTDDNLIMGFAPEGSVPGPVTKSDAQLGTTLSTTSGGGAGSATGASGVSSGWGSPGQSSNMVTARAAGISFTVHRLAKVNFEGFVNELVSELGYHPQSIGGYNFRKIAGSSSWSNHAYGAAIDIDPTRNPRYGSASGGPYALPHPPAIINLARKWGLYWGGEYHNSKDYMHFEVIGAPSTPAVPGYKPGQAAPVIVSKWKPPIHGDYTITARFGEGGNHWSNGHSGTDFACPTGTPIYAIGPGVVHKKGFSGSDYGNYITLDMGGGYYTLYGHMNEPTTLSVGDVVGSDTVLGKVGQTGNATGPHCHLELRKGADEYANAISIEKYVLGGANRSDPPTGTMAVQDSTMTDPGTAQSGVWDVAQVGQGLFNVYQYNLSAPSQEGMLLTGYRALMNDVPILDTVNQLMGVGLRHYCSAPNGDFIGWFPDYFGHYKQAGKMEVADIEIDISSGPPTIGWDDTNLKTHQFVSSATGPGINDASSVWRMATTAGVASVEFPDLMAALMHISKDEAQTMATDFLMRYGARPDFTPLDQVTGPRQEFFFACHLFMQNWSQQYQATVNVTFMPELYPGMLLVIPSMGIQGYVRQTTDSWDLEGGGFRTSVSCAPWSTIGDAKVAGGAHLPRGAPL